jgi:hypothetical protein
VCGGSDMNTRGGGEGGLCVRARAFLCASVCLNVIGIPEGVARAV